MHYFQLQIASWRSDIFVYCRMMESRIADQEEEKRARERIRQRIADDKVCCSMLKFCLIYTNNSVVLTVFFFQHAHNSSNKSFIFWHFYYLGFPHWKIVTLCSSESDEISRPFFIFFVHCVDFIKPSSSHWLRSSLPLNHELCSRWRHFLIL